MSAPRFPLRRLQSAQRRPSTFNNSSSNRISCSSSGDAVVLPKSTCAARLRCEQGLSVPSKSKMGPGTHLLSIKIRSPTRALAYVSSYLTRRAGRRRTLMSFQPNVHSRPRSYAISRLAHSSLSASSSMSSRATGTAQLPSASGPLLQVTKRRKD